MINSALDAVVGVLVVMLLGAIAGWLAGSSAFYMKRFFNNSKKVRLEVYTILLTVFLTTCVFLVLLALFVKNNELSFGLTMLYLTMFIFPFVLISAYAAYTAWWHHQSQYLKRDKIKTAMSGLNKLRSINLK